MMEPTETQSQCWDRALSQSLFNSMLLNVHFHSLWVNSQKQIFQDKGRCVFNYLRTLSSLPECLYHFKLLPVTYERIQFLHILASIQYGQCFPFQPFWWVVVPLIWLKGTPHPCLLCIFLLTNNVDNFFMCLFTSHISSLVKFKCFAHFFAHFLLITVSFYWDLGVLEYAIF